MPSTPAHEWQLRLRPLPDEPGGPDHVQRMRRLLKAALRVYGFRCEGLMTPSTLPPVPPELDPCVSEPPFHSPIAHVAAGERKRPDTTEKPP